MCRTLLLIWNTASFPPPEILLLYSLLKMIPTSSKSHFFLDPPRQIPVCGVLEEGQCLAVYSVLWCPALGGIVALRMLAGSQQGMQPCARARYSQAAVPAGILQAGKNRLPSANTDSPWQAQGQKSLGGSSFPSRNITLDTAPLSYYQMRNQAFHVPLFPICGMYCSCCSSTCTSFPNSLIPPHTFHCAMNKQD